MSWLFGDLAGIVNPAARGPGSPPTRRSARWLIGIGLIVALFGVGGLSSAFGGSYEPEGATIIGKYRVATGGTTGDYHKVRIRLDDGSVRTLHNAVLYDDIGHQLGQRITVDIKHANESIKAVHWKGRSYGNTSPVAVVVVTILFLAVGTFLLLRGIGRRRRARYFERHGPESPSHALPT